MPFRALCLFLILALSVPAAALADEYHYNNILIGDRASGMGGAYTGVSDDPAGLYYNPAGIVYSTGRSLSASVNAFYNLEKTYDKVIGGYDWVRSSSALLPNYFGIVQPLGKLKVGFSYAVPDSIREDQDQFFTFTGLSAGLGNSTTVDSFGINFNNEDTIYNFGPSIAGEIAKDFSLGFTLYFHQRSAQIINNQIVRLSDDRYQWRNIYDETNEFGIRPILGAMWSPADKVSLGLSASKTFVLDSDRTVQSTRKDISEGLTFLPGTTLATSSTAEKKEYPLELRAGVGYFPNDKLVVSGDLSYYSEVTDETFGDREMVMNAAVGTEYYMNKNWAFRGGIFTNMANTEELSANARNQREHIDIYGAGASASHFTKNTSVTIGGNLSYGTGQAQVIESSTTLNDVTVMAWTMFISSSYSY